MKKKILLTLTSLILVFSLIGCGNESNKMTASVAEDCAEGFYGDIENENISYDKAESTTDENNTNEYSQKLIKKYNLSFQTTNYDESFGFIKSEVIKNNGYIEDSSTYGKKPYRNSTLVIRIPESNAEAFLSTTGNIGELISQSESAEDVTLNYYDTQSKIESLETQRQRLNELLTKAETLSDIIQIEDKLEEVESEINEYGTRLKVLENLVNYVTITIEIDEVQNITIVEEDSFFTQIKKRFTSNFKDVIDGIESFIITVITNIPYIVVAVIIAGIIIFIINKIKKKAKMKLKNMEKSKPEEENKE